MSERISIIDLLKKSSKKSQSRESDIADEHHEIADEHSENVEKPNYNLEFPPDNYQRYFNYEVKGEDKKPVGVCRKCNQTIARTNGGTNGMMKHMKTCDLNAWNELNKRKVSTASVTLSFDQPSNQPITEFFTVSV